MATHAEFAARYRDNEFIIDHNAGTGHGRAFGRVGIFGFPQLLARVGIQTDHLAVQGDHENFALDIVEPTVYHITAGHRNGSRVLFGRVAPLDLIGLLGEIESVDVIRIGRMHVHGAADHQRGTFMAA